MHYMFIHTLPKNLRLLIIADYSEIISTTMVCAVVYLCVSFCFTGYVSSSFRAMP